jgi:class 3 adenylate cyclase/tetratricopeptide (TPR) repeat protein
MLICDNCGEQNLGSARFCSACGHPLGSEPARRETRKTVTVVFCDVTGSTALGERLDPESQRAVMGRYFEEMRHVLERHGGTVEKFIGDAVMAVFGVPHLHEDDALRAVRAAVEMRDRLEALNVELERDRGVRIAMRVGVNTGEVVAGDPGERQKFVTGDPVVVAKRLEAAAGPGEILVGDLTARLVRGAALLEELEPRSLKGKSKPVGAWRLLEVSAHVPELGRRLDAPLVGRHEELARLVAEVDAVERERAARLVTVVGEAGLGKSRLAHELAEHLGGRVRFLSGRCLAYGDGITFWPLREILAQAGGADAVATELGPGDEGKLVLERVRGAIGAGTGAGGGEETFWAVRKLVEALARARPLVLCLEDVHWAEPTFLELVEYLAGWIRDAPVLLLCLARPELAEEHPAWRGGAGGAVVTLSPLTEDEAAELVAGLGGDGGLDEPTRVRIAAAAEGNPLFAEHLAALLAEQPSAGLSIPPTIHALLAARLDRLEPEERAVLERAAVMGREFWRRAIVDLTPPAERAHAGSHLHALVRRNLIRPDPGSGSEDGFRFSHVLVRDAAYAAVPKELRADLHERFADWIEANAGRWMSEVEEIVGYHLEQAYRYREQLGPVDERGRSVAARAAELLGRAGRRAFARQDMPAAANLLDRAVALATEREPARMELLRELSGAFWSTGEVARAEALLDALLEAASVAGDRRMELYGILDRLDRQQHTAPSELLAQAQEALPVFEAAGDDAGLARAWRRIGSAHHMRLHYADAEVAAGRAVAYAEAAGDYPEYARSVDLVCIALLYGPSPADEGIRRCEEFRTGTARSPLADANVLAALAGLRAMRGDFDGARSCVDAAGRIYDSLGLLLAGAGLAHVSAHVELLADRPDATASGPTTRPFPSVRARSTASTWPRRSIAGASSTRHAGSSTRESASCRRSWVSGSASTLSLLSWTLAPATSGGRWSARATPSRSPRKPTRWASTRRLCSRSPRYSGRLRSTATLWFRRVRR